MMLFSSPLQLGGLTAEWFGESLVVIDFEGSARSSVVEAGVVRMMRSGEVSAWTERFRPRARITQEETATHGLNDVDLADCAPFNERFDLFRQLRQQGVFAAHHAVVENRFVCDAWPLPGWVPDWMRPLEKVSSWGPWLDSRVLAERLYPKIKDYRLSSLVHHWGLQETLDQWALHFCPADRSRYHCALYDALASWLLLLYMAEQREWHEWKLPRLLRLQQEGSETGAQQMDWLL